MKFAKRIEAERIPEWRDKYLDYKRGKQTIKNGDLYTWLDNELAKIETFYKEREDAACKYLSTLKSQLDILKSQRDGGASVDDRTKAMFGNIRHPTASRRLRHAILEFYHEIEQLQEYAIMNHVAFRKINKKQDKASDAPVELTFLREKVDTAHFVTSTTMEDCRLEVLNLYAANFEDGNIKVARSRLYAYHRNPKAHGRSAFRNGLLIAAGTVLGVQGLVDAIRLLNNPYTVLSTSYLLQVYAGFLLPVVLAILFCLTLKVFDYSRINYALILELNPRNRKDWKQLTEIPALLYFVLCLVLYLNFSTTGKSDMYVYWPLIVLGAFAFFLAIPAPLFYPKTREWLGINTLRVMSSGSFNVHFRDFFLGDLFCSLTYTFGNIELISCLYIKHWSNPVQCNSSHSMAFGFLTTLPLLFRFFQCLRRFYDSGRIFPNLANAGKYMASVLYYMTLSLYRLHRGGPLQKRYEVSFILFASINSLYTTAWDIVLDWSLISFSSSAPVIRKELAFPKWLYICAMIIDPIIRFNWIFYFAAPMQFQHSSLVSFFVALSEVFRRGMWLIFRIENEHCTNIIQARVTREVRLPYHMPLSGTVTPEMTTSDWWDRIGVMLHLAHTNDFERQNDYDPSLAEQDDDDDDD